jgi:acyl dehydratase
MSPATIAAARATQRYFEDVASGEDIPTVSFPITVYRLVMEAGANRDFNSIHHNTEYARSTGAPDMYANTLFLLGMWERAMREWIGCGGTIRAIRGFRMVRFNVVGDTTRVVGRVLSTRREGDVGVVVLEVRSENSNGVTVGPGQVEVTLPARGG